jgi:hypothetical protein
MASSYWLHSAIKGARKHPCDYSTNLQGRDFVVMETNTSVSESKGARWRNKVYCEGISGIRTFYMMSLRSPPRKTRSPPHFPKVFASLPDEGSLAAGNELALNWCHF